MSMHVKFIQKQLNGDPIRVAGEAMAEAVVLTDTQLVVGYAGLFGRWGGKLQQYDLSRMSGLETTPDPRVNVLRVVFGGSPPQSVRILYENEARAAFGQMIKLLQERLASNRQSAAQ